MLLHGGDLDAISKEYNICRDDIIDFSGNINPFSICSSIKDIVSENIDIIATYPDKDYNNLRQAIATYCECEKEHIIVGSGATELISLFIKNLRPKRTILISPSYSEYERELTNINCEILYFDLRESEGFTINIDRLLACLENDIDLIVLCNPNNPTGSAIKNEDMEKILKKVKFLMLDETYAEFTKKSENIQAISLIEKYNNLFIIRGTSKFFGVPGIRLGYGLCNNANILEEINQNKQPWSVNSLATLIGENMFYDNAYVEKTLHFITHEREKFLKELSQIKNLKVYNSKSNFILCKILNGKITSNKLFEKLIENNILIRDAQNFTFLDDTFFRFCILTEENNDLLIYNLKNILN